MPKTYYNFEHLGLTLTGTGWMVAVAAIAVGIIVAVAAALVIRVWHYRIVKAFVDHGADDIPTAKTLGEVGLGNRWLIRRMTRPGTPLGKTLACANEEELAELPKKAKVRAESARLYLPAEKKDAAELRFTKEKHPIATFVITLVLVAAAAVFVIKFIPNILGAVDRFLASIEPESKFL